MGRVENMRKDEYKSDWSCECLVGWMRKMRYKLCRRGELWDIELFRTVGREVRTR